MMRIKYIYQLLTSHISILILAFAITGAVFSHFVKDFAYQSKVSELTSYGYRIMGEMEEHPPGDQPIMKPFAEILKSRQINFFLFNAKKEVLMTPDHLRPRKLLLKDEEWKELKEGKPVVVKTDLQRFNQEVSVVALPNFVNNEFQGGILLTAPISGTEEMISQMNRFMLCTAAGVILLAFLLSWLTSKFHVGRIQKLRDATKKVAAGDYNIHIENRNMDEIGDLGADFNVMAQKLKSSSEEIDRLEKRRRQFITDVSHELKTPLTTISGLVEGLNSQTIPENQQEKCLKLITEETKRLIRLVNENLDYEKIRSNQITLNKLHYPLIEVFEIIKEQLAIQAEEKNDKLILDVEEHVMVHADYDRLIQILVNITKNSIQFTTNGTVWLRGWEDYKETVIEIEDTGIGIDEKDIESIWDRFYKADLSRTNTPYGEYGLGLSIVRQLVALHQGTVELTSEKNKGTKFVIRLPLTSRDDE
ncbi:HAMP domain-containing histidine kinase [Bacillus glycinifermentans]|nr:HAMP domain-containing histidine kinase [Bacillus glycinifermentans]